MLTHRAEIDNAVLFTCHHLWYGKKTFGSLAKAVFVKLAFGETRVKKKNNKGLVHLHSGFVFTILLSIVSVRNAMKFIYVFLYPPTVLSTGTLRAS